MLDDWARKYIVVHTQRQQEKLNIQRRADLAAVGAPDVFQRVKERIQQDIQTFHDAGVLLNLEMWEQGTSKGKFEVVAKALKTGGPVATMTVELNIIFINYVFFARGGERDEEKPGALRLCSDVGGIIKVYKNGRAFTDESEISQFLLQPLLDFIDG